MIGSLYGIGIGPGDPELLTAKAIKILGRADHIFAAASSKNDYCVAFDIARQYVRTGTQVDYLAFSMTFNPGRLEDAGQTNCEKVKSVLSEGENAAFLTLGDPLTFSTYI